MKTNYQFNLIDKGLRVDMALSRESLIATLHLGRYEVIEEREVDSFMFDLDDSGRYQQQQITVNVYVKKLPWDQDRGELYAHIYKAPKILGRYQLMITRTPAISDPDQIVMQQYYPDLRSAKAAAKQAQAKAWNY